MDVLFDDLGRFFSAAIFERFKHGQLRQGFLIGWAIMIGAGLLTVWWVLSQPDTDSDVCRSGVAFLIAVSLIGALVKTNTDVKDQEEGRFSKMGSGWHLWGDNIWFNKLDQFFLTCGIIFMFGGSIFFALQAQAKAAYVKPVGVNRAVKSRTHPGSAKDAGAAVASVHLRHHHGHHVSQIH